ncbi:pectinesterase [Marasmius fiardii PR-910]|nr:pectinesterase [Marasmius fiardii PR-910]
MLFRCLSLTLFLALVQAASRNSPPAGAIAVRPGTTTAGEFSTIKAALASLPNDSSARSIFLYPGTYNEQVLVSRTGPTTIYGSTTSTSTYTANGATIAFSMGADQAGSNDASGTLRVHSDNFKIYNVNIKNTRGPGVQAIAVSVQSNKVGFYGCALYGYQDTLLANTGNQVYLKGYIEGKTDFIFGTTAQAYFGGNTIAVSGAGFITADGRDNSGSGLYVFNGNTVVQASDAESGTSGGYYFGRPWRPFARVVFKSTVVNVAPHSGLWSLWDGDATSVSNTLFADFNTTGSAAGGISRASFATLLSASQASQYTIATTVGSDYTSWVDAAYVV